MIVSTIKIEVFQDSSRLRIVPWKMAKVKMLCLLVLLCMVAVRSETEKDIAQGSEKGISQDDKVQCVKKFVEWCNNMQYPEEGANGIALLSIAYRDDKDFYRIFCSSDSEGTNCSRNGSPLFSCTPDHVFKYKGEVLTETTTDVDDEICKTQDKAFNELFVQNLSYDNSTLAVVEKELKSFFNEMLAMRQQIRELQKRLGDSSFMGHDFWKGFGNDFPFNHNEEEDDSETEETNENKDSNQIERE